MHYSLRFTLAVAALSIVACGAPSGTDGGADGHSDVHADGIGDAVRDAQDASVDVFDAHLDAIDVSDVVGEVIGDAHDASDAQQEAGSCVDHDLDGYGMGSGCLGPDCDDNDANVHPAAPEICDGLDNDCNGMVDDGLGTTMCGVGACQHSVDNCVGGAVQRCTPGMPMTEVCDGVDNDCNGLVDEGIPDITCGVGACLHTVPGCMAGAVPTCTPGTPATEICDGIDNNCNGMIDEGFGAVTCGVGACQRTTSSCSGGTTGMCTPGAPTMETCDGIDNDCNGMVDDGLGTTMCGVGACARTVPNCVSGRANMCTAGLPASEVCNGVDDNCNGVVDEGFGTTSCGMGACMRTVNVCSMGMLQSCVPAVPTAEICNGLDDNCNGAVDEGLGATTCGMGICTRTVNNCMGGAPQTCVPATAMTEICNGLDDNCNGMIDDGLGSTTCGVGACRRTVSNCVAGTPEICAPGAATMETCNNIDDNCDGLVDNGVTQTCYAGPAGTSGVGICRSGMQTCAAGAWGVCGGQVLPAVETCNNADDNCNGSVDEGVTQTCYSGAAGTQGVGACHSGTQTCSAGAFGSCSGQVVPTTETCNNIDDNCNGSVDESVTQACYTGAAGTSGVGLCHGGTQTCSAGAFGACAGQIVPGAEICNNLDDNCNGLIDESVTRACYTGAAGTSGVGACHGGTQTCSAGAYGACAGQVIPVAETCNNVDDNCDGLVDNGVTQSCYSGPAGTQGIGACRAGTQTCSGGAFGACGGQVVPAAETCNNVDDNCDGLVDNGVTQACYTGPVGTSGVGVCHGGTQTCSGGAFGACGGQVVPAGEICGNGLDDDCNGVVDNGCGPANDECAGATAIALGAGTTTVSGSTASATHSATNGCGSGPDIWYSFTLAGNELVYVDLLGATYDTEVGLYTTCGGAVTACNDDSCGTVQSQTTAVLGAGTHFISVGGYASYSGAYTLRIQHIPVPSATASGTLIAGTQTLTGDTTGAPVVFVGCGYNGATLWYSYVTCPSYVGGTMSANTCTTGYDTVIDFQNGDAAGGACNDDACGSSGLQSSISGAVSAGAGVHVYFESSFSSNVGPFTATVTVP